MTQDLSRLLKPKSIALFGGAWAENVIDQLQKSAYAGEIWPVHPTRESIRGIRCFSALDQLPSPPDASFVGVNRELSIEIISTLSKMGAGGATCFASGYLESEGEASGGADLQARLIEAAGDMPILGPNCYGLLNYLDNVTLWPDQHGGRPCDKGVAIIGQSSNVLINMTMQKRSLPIAYTIAAGNQAQTQMSDIASHLLDDERVTAIGLYIEGFGDIRKLETMAAKARKLNKPIVAIKTGKSEKSKLATLTHTASLAGSATASSALMKRLGIVEVYSIAVFLETLKLLHMFGALENNLVASMSCSGGEAGLVSDMAEASAIEFRDFSSSAKANLKAILGPLVTVSNPLDYHTFIWGEPEKLEATYSAVLEDGYDLTLLIMDVPPPPRTCMDAWKGPLDAAIAAAKKTKGKMVLLATLPENLSEALGDELMANGICPMHGMEEMILAIDAAIRAGELLKSVHQPVLLAKVDEKCAAMLDEATSKSLLSRHGVSFPKSVTGKTPGAIANASKELKFPVALKGLGIAHKSEAGAVKLGLSTPSQVEQAANAMQGMTGFLAEEMVSDPLAEILIGVTRDTTGLYVLTLGAGGVLTELIEDTVSVLLPTTETDIKAALENLKVSQLLFGFRGRPSADISAIIACVLSIQDFCLHNPDVVELDINPLICLAQTAIAVDAVIVK